MASALLLLEQHGPFGLFSVIIIYMFRYYFIRMEAGRDKREAVVNARKETVEKSQDELEKEYRLKVESMQVEFRRELTKLQSERLAEARKVGENTAAYHEKTLRALIENTTAIQAIRKSFDNLTDVINYTRKMP